MNRTKLHWTLLAACLMYCSPVAGQLNWIAPGDEIWLISARDLGVGCNGPLHCQRFCDGIWQESCCEDLYQANDDRPNYCPVIFVHGYQTDLQSARLRGIQVYRNLFSCCHPNRPIRYIIWAWKSERESRRVVREFNLKAKHAKQLGDAFAMTLNGLQSQPPTVIAYSLGAQVCLSALVQSEVYAGAPVKLAIIAAATDCGFSACCLRTRNCGHVAKSYVFSNRGDLAIRAARLSCLLANGRRPGKLEQIAPRFPDQLGDVNIVDITTITTRKHSVERYTMLPVVIGCINELMAINCSEACCAAVGGTGQSIEQDCSVSVSDRNRTDDVCVKR